MRFLAYTLEYKGGPVSIDLKVRCYSEPDYKEYKHIYEEYMIPLDAPITEKLYIIDDGDHSTMLLASEY